MKLKKRICRGLGMSKKKSEELTEDMLGRKVTFYTRGGPRHGKLVDYEGVVVGVSKGKIRVRMGKGKRSRSFFLKEISGLERTD